MDQPPPNYSPPPSTQLFAAPAPPPKRHFPWLVPLISLVEIGMFIYTMYENNCPSQIPKDLCLGHEFLYSFSFQPRNENAMLGPAPETLTKLGALDRKLVLHGEAWRLFSYIWLHAGVVQLTVNVLVLNAMIGLKIEREFGFLRFGLVFFLSGLGGALANCLNILKHSQNGSPLSSVGPVGAIFGLMGASLSEIITNWTVIKAKISSFMMIVLSGALFMVLFCILKIDMSLQVGGLIAGFFLGFVFLVKPQLGHVSSKYISSDTNVKSAARHNLCQYILGIIGLVILVSLYGAGFEKLFNVKEIKEELPNTANKF